ncbi:hypothetical protein [Streptomyces sp. NBRC 109706]|uniref:hypothetical protein n=1 Tax=Streptomyces sp. NBRC 109706 TaxID=1550035 RepID=UPI0007825B70|nr:hypothetical protein [Streptomyces sp. NBRC 109706]
MGVVRTPRRRIVAAATVDPRGVAGYLPTRTVAGAPWDLYRLVPELQSGIEWLANAVSRARLYVALRQTDGDYERVTDPNVTAIVDEVFGDGAAQGEILRRIVTHLKVAGETFLFPYNDSRDTAWAVACPSELRTGVAGLEYQTDAASWAPIHADRMVRLWHPDPEHGWRAHSQVLAMEPLLRQIIALTARSIAVNESRLAGNGILGLPDGLSTPVPTSEGQPNPVRPPDVITALEEAMVQPMTDRGLASSVVPFTLVGAREDIAGIRWITMASELDGKLTEHLEQGLRRMAMSMSLPPEIVLGLGGSNHWNAFEIVDQAVTTMVEPEADLITHAATIGILRPELKRRGITLPRVAVRPDLTDLIVPPDRSQAARSARQNGLLSNEAWARYEGFSEQDLPSADERLQNLIEDVVRNAPSQAPYLLPVLGYDVSGYTDTRPTDAAQDQPGSGEGNSTDQSTDTQEAAEPPTTPGRPQRPAAPSATANLLSMDPPIMPPDPAEALLTGVEAAVIRVLERANNRLWRAHSRSVRPELREVPIIQMHAHLPVTAAMKDRMLKGAYTVWEDTLPGVVPLVSSYVDYLIDNQIPHSRDLLADTLSRVAEESAMRDNEALLEPTDA